MGSANRSNFILSGKGIQFISPKKKFQKSLKNSRLINMNINVLIKGFLWLKSHFSRNYNIKFKNKLYINSKLLKFPFFNMVFTYISSWTYNKFKENMKILFIFCDIGNTVVNEFKNIFRTNVVIINWQKIPLI
jgi:hypothetical protein